MLRAQFAAHVIQVGAICRGQMPGAHFKKFCFTQSVGSGSADKRFSPGEVLAGEMRAASGPGGGIAVIDVEHRGADCNIAKPFQGQEIVAFSCCFPDNKMAWWRMVFEECSQLPVESNTIPRT